MAKNHIVELYESLVNNTFTDSLQEFHYQDMDPKEVHYNRLLKHAKEYLDWWKWPYCDKTAVNLEKENPKLAASWLYEHTIFDLVKIYKDFNPKKQYVVFMGW